MGGLFGVASETDCTTDLFYGTDYHSHLGTRRGGMAVRSSDGIQRKIHNIENSYFRSKFEPELSRFEGSTGIGVISDTDPQPLVIGSHLGSFAIVTVGRINNLEDLAGKAFHRGAYFSDAPEGLANPTELAAMLICREETYEAGILRAQELIEGSLSILLLTEKGIFAARDRMGRTPLAIGTRKGAVAVTSETCALANLGFETARFLGPGEVAHITPDGCETRIPPRDTMRICAFLWVYYGYPASDYEGINVEHVRNRCGAALASRDDTVVDCVAGIPDSGIGHAIGYANARGLPYRRPFVKYTPTWPRSFMPQKQSLRDLVARMKLIPIRALIEDRRLLFCEDSIVRGTQLKRPIRSLFSLGAREVHMRPACPTLIYPCRFLNFSTSRSTMDLVGRRVIAELEGEVVAPAVIEAYATAGTERHAAMVESIRKRLGLTSLQFQRIEDLTSAIGLSKDDLCTYCWDGVGEA